MPPDPEAVELSARVVSRVPGVNPHRPWLHICLKHNGQEVPLLEVKGEDIYSIALIIAGAE
jgi:hypothetical protein